MIGDESYTVALVLIDKLGKIADIAPLSLRHSRINAEDDFNYIWSNLIPRGEKNDK